MMRSNQSSSVINGIVLLLVITLGGCTQHHSLKPEKNPERQVYGSIEESRPIGKYRNVYASEVNCTHASSQYSSLDYTVNKVLVGNGNRIADNDKIYALFNGDLTLSPGDMIEVAIEDGEGFNGRYIISPKGSINLPYLRSLKVQGLDVYQTAEKIEMALVRAEIFRPSTVSINVQVLDWAEIDVLVSGAVFQPGRQFINQKSKDNAVSEKMTAFGDFSRSRLLSEALRSASGIRPDAKLDQVILIRNGWQMEVDMSGVMTGQQVQDIPLISGDQVVVPTTGCFQRHLVRPSQITPKGFRVFMSNLIDSAESNSNAAVGRYSTNLPYGARLLQGAVSANCVGGKQWTNAPRKVVLASNNPLTGKFEVVERSIEDLMRQAHDDTMNPYLMPNDAIACYDSDVTNLRDIAQFMMEIINPIKAI